MLRNVQPEDIVIVGERDGISYGQWKGGPAGTLNMEFDWRFAENVDAESRVRMERAGKLWSRRIMDEFGTHVAASGTQVVHGDIRETLDEEITTNGLVVFVLDKGPSSDRISSGGPGYFFVTADDLEPWLGSILLNRRHHDDSGRPFRPRGRRRGWRSWGIEIPPPSLAVFSCPNRAPAWRRRRQ